MRASPLLVSVFWLVVATGCRAWGSEVACDQVGACALSSCTLAASLAPRCRRGDASAVTAEYARIIRLSRPLKGGNMSRYALLLILLVALALAATAGNIIWGD
jgi:hypothetical protein